jgi:cystine transport system substrate-binding protein
MKKLFLNFARVLLGVAFLSAISHTAVHADTLNTIQHAKKIRVGVGFMGTKPFVWQDDKGQYHGFENEMLQALIKKLGVDNYEYVVTDWSTLIPGLKSGRWDIIMTGMVETEERIQGGGISMSRPYFFVYDRIIVPEDSPIKSENDLKDKVLGAMLGTTDSLVAHTFVDSGKAADVKDFNTFTEPFLALRNKQVDAVIFDQVTFSGQRTQMPDLTEVGAPLPYIPAPAWAARQAKANYKLGGVGIGVRLDDPRLLNAVNQALDQMDADGERQAILTKYHIWDGFQSKAAMMK